MAEDDVKLRALAEAENSRGWYKVDFNEGDDPAYRPLWGVSNEAYFNPPADENEPWLAVEIHTGTEATAAFIAAANPTAVLALLDRVEAAEAAVDAVRRRHPRGDEEPSVLAPGLWCPGCGRERADNGYGGCPDRAALTAVTEALRGPS